MGIQRAPFPFCENTDAVKSEMMVRKRHWLEELAHQQNDVGRTELAKGSVIGVNDTAVVTAEKSPNQAPARS